MVFKKRILSRGVGRRLRKLREHLNISRPQMAAAVEIQNAGYNKNENGDNFPRVKTLHALNRKFKVSMDWLLFNEGTMFLDNQAANIEEELQRLKTKEIELETVLEQKKELETQLEQVNEWENRLAGFKDTEPEIKELLDLMLKDPQMRHEVLAHLYKYKKKGEVMSSE